jgi:hypothetical protein
MKPLKPAHAKVIVRGLNKHSYATDNFQMYSLRPKKNDVLGFKICPKKNDVLLNLASLHVHVGMQQSINT